MRTNCKNCGATLLFNETNYGKKAKCSYCGTEYHIDLLGRVEEYKVKLEVMGKIREFYIGNFTINKVFLESSRDIEGHLIYAKEFKKIKMNLIEL